jgi:hypothetical protein
MDPAQVERVRRTLRRRAKPPWRLLWRAGPPAPWVGARTLPGWQRRLIELQAGLALLWAQRLRRDLDPIYLLVACRRGRHRDAHVLADDLVGSQLGDDYPEVAVCEVCGRAVEWPNGMPAVVARELE